MFHHEIFGWELLLAVSATNPLSAVHLLLVVYPITAVEVLFLRVEAVREGANVWP